MEYIKQSYFGRLSEPKKIFWLQEIKVVQSNNFLKDDKIILFL
jgi:hypothetical protein